MTRPLSRATSVCREQSRLLGPYADGELEPGCQCALEDHVAECSFCSEQLGLLRASRVSMQRVVHAPVPSALRARLMTALAAEQDRERARSDTGSSRGKTAWRALVPLATAAAFALAWGVFERRSANSSQVNDLLADLVAEHSQPLPPDATDPKAVRNLEKYVGVPVQAGRFERVGATFVGGRVLPLHQQRAAMLQYVVGTGDNARRVSVLVFDPQRIQVNHAEFAPRAVGSSQVQVGTAKGYSVALAERAGVGYALLGDLDAEKSAQFAATVYDE